jgi:hypothetical protein
VTTSQHPVFVRAFRLLVFCISTFLLFQFISLYLSWPKQALLGALSLAIVILLSRSSKSHVVTLALMLISIAATLRYGWWRIHLVADFFSESVQSPPLHLLSAHARPALGGDLYRLHHAARLHADHLPAAAQTPAHAPKRGRVAARRCPDPHL